MTQNRTIYMVEMFAKPKPEILDDAISQTPPFPAVINSLQSVENMPILDAQLQLSEISHIVSEEQVTTIGVPARSRIGIKLTKMISFMDPEDIVAVIAQGNRVKFLRLADSCLVRESISVVAEKLKSFGFIRIHRSVVVNRSHVQEIRASKTGDYALRVSGSREFAVTRMYQRNLQDLAAFWMGTNGFMETAQLTPIRANS